MGGSWGVGRRTSPELRSMKPPAANGNVKPPKRTHPTPLTCPNFARRTEAFPQRQTQQQPLVLLLLLGVVAPWACARAGGGPLTPSAQPSQLTCAAEADFSGQTLQGRDWLQTVRNESCASPPLWQPITCATGTAIPVARLPLLRHTVTAEMATAGIARARTGTARVVRVAAVQMQMHPKKWSLHQVPNTAMPFSGLWSLQRDSSNQPALTPAPLIPRKFASQLGEPAVTRMLSLHASWHWAPLPIFDTHR